jgi:hypothetical protein
MSKLEWLLWALDFGIAGIAYFAGGPYAGLLCFFVAGVLILIGLTSKDESENKSQPSTLLVDYADRPYKSSPKGKKWHKWGLAVSIPVVIILLLYGARKYVNLGRTNTDQTLKATVETSSLFYAPDAKALPNPIATAIMTIKNAGNYPTTVSDFWLLIRWKDGSATRIKSGQLPEVLALPYQDGQKETMYPEDDLNYKGENPIPIGGQIVGRLMFQSSEINPYRIQNEFPDEQIVFKDVRGVDYSAPINLEHPAGGTNREFFGMRPRFKTPD